MKLEKKNAFTLAEVLITLGIIGVVAALTMPALMTNTKVARFNTQYKKTLSILNQVGMTAEAQYGYNWAGVTEDCGGASDNPETKYSICALFNKILVGEEYREAVGSVRLSSGKYYNDIVKGVNTHAYGYILADGSMFAFTRSWFPCTENSPCYGFIDVNGFESPNKVASCVNKNGLCGSDATNPADIFPVKFYDSIFEPTSADPAYGTY